MGDENVIIDPGQYDPKHTIIMDFATNFIMALFVKFIILGVSKPAVVRYKTKKIMCMHIIFIACI